MVVVVQVLTPPGVVEVLKGFSAETRSQIMNPLLTLGQKEGATQLEHMMVLCARYIGTG